MKRHVKAFGITAALAVMIPLSAYAATTGTSGSTGTGTGSPEVKAERPVWAEGGRMEGRGGKQALASQEVLGLLKLDKAAFEEKVKAGKTLAQIAEEQGISRDALKTALTSEHDKKLAEEKQNFADRLDSMIDAAPKAGGKEFRGGIKAQVGLTEAAAVLGVTEDELKTSLAGGKSLADVAKEKGVDSQKVVDAIKASIAAQLKQAVTDGKLTQEEADKRAADSAAMADKIVNGKGFGPKGGHGGGRGHGGFGGGPGGPGAKAPDAGTDAGSDTSADG